mgnify:CR=1 FL=1
MKIQARIESRIENNKVIILLSGGNKGSQSKDIKSAEKLWESYKTN